MLVPSRFADLPPPRARLFLAIIALLTVALVGASFVVRLPERRPPPPEMENRSPDLEAYWEIASRVRGGESYYDAAKEVLTSFGFRTSSIFNWRLPTYAWFFSLFPDPKGVQAVLAVLAGIAMLLTLAGERRELPVLPSALTLILLVGVIKWIFDGEAYLAQEVWAGVLLLLSVSAYGVDQRGVAVAAGLVGLAFRELVLPYCVIALALACWQRRWGEAAAWLVGILLFFGFLGWHAGQVMQRMPADAPPGGVMDWFVFGGLGFVLSTLRMNGWLFSLPLPALALYLCVALLGLIGWKSERGLLLALASVAYLAAFAMVGLPYNFNWGMLTAPLLAFGPVRAPRAVYDLLQAARAPLRVAAKPNED